MGRALTVFTCALMLVHGALLLRFVHQNCYFFGDDYTNFWIALHRPVKSALWLPFGGQIAPLSRALNQIFYAIFAANYDAALALLCALHVLGAFVLYRVLERLKPSFSNLVIVALYSTYVNLWIQLGWWASGMERIPYMVLSLLAIHAYLHFGETRRPRQLVACVAWIVLAVGFYVKAVFLPLVLLTLDWARSESPRGLRRLLARAEVAALLALFVAGVGYVVLVHRWLADTLPRPSFDLLQQLGFLSKSLNVFAHSRLGIVLLPTSAPKLWVPLVWLAFAGYAIWRAPRTLPAFVGALLVLSLNILVVGLSSRMGLWGALMAFEGRYYYDADFLVLVFLALVLHELPSAGSELPLVPSALRSQVPALLLGLALLAQTLTSYGNMRSSAFAISSALPQTRRYVATLKSDLSRLAAAGAALKLLDGDLPVFVSGLDLNFRKQSQLCTVLQIPAEFVPAPAARFRIDGQGHVLPAL